MPIYVSGQCRGWVARDWTDLAASPYLYPKGMQRAHILFNQDAVSVDTDEPLVVVEGVFDALKLWPNAVAVLGKPAKNHVGILRETTRPIVVALDADAKDDGWALATELFLNGNNSHFLELPPGEDPGSVDLNWLKKSICEVIDA